MTIFLSIAALAVVAFVGLWLWAYLDEHERLASLPKPVPAIDENGKAHYYFPSDFGDYPADRRDEIVRRENEANGFERFTLSH